MQAKLAREGAEVTKKGGEAVRRQVSCNPLPAIAGYPPHRPLKGGPGEGVTEARKQVWGASYRGLAQSMTFKAT